MKKSLLALGLLCIVGANEGFAQPWVENFNNGLPSTWTLHNVDNRTPYSSVSFVNQAWVTRIKTNPAGAPIPGDSVIISNSWYSPAGAANDWVVTPLFTVSDPNMVLKWDAKAFDKTYSDGYEVLISTTGNMPSDFTTVLYSTAGAPSEDYKTRGASLNAYNGQSVYIAFRNNSNDKYLLGLDNVEALVLATTNDVAVDGVVLPVISATDFIAINGNAVKATVTNKGAQNITSLELSYSVNGGAPVVQTFTGLNIGPYNQEILTFTTAISGVNVGLNNIVIEALQVNGQTDDNLLDNQKAVAFTGASKGATRAGIIEEFTSSTCVPCASFNVTFDPLISSNNVNQPASNFNVIKYQMNWPSPGTDASYNSHGATRKDYYAVNSIPSHFTNGRDGTTGDQAEIDASKIDPAFMDISGTYVITKDSVYVDVSVAPFFTKAGGNYKVYIAAVEKEYINAKATTNQDEYIHVMRAMFPNGNGNLVTGWTDGTPVGYKYSMKYDVSEVTQGSYRFWTHPKNSNVVVFVQDNTTKEILQSKVIVAQWPVSVEELSMNLRHCVVFPNPANEAANVAFELTEATDVRVSVYDAVGRVVYNNAEKMQAGIRQFSIPTINLSNGLYTIKLEAGNNTITERLSIAR